MAKYSDCKHSAGRKMDLYSDLIGSVIECGERAGLRHGPRYTLAMLVLGLGFCLNGLSLINLLWTWGMVPNPYFLRGALHPRHFVYGVAYGMFLANLWLARRTFPMDWENLEEMPRTSGLAAPDEVPLWHLPGPIYVLASMLVFVLTLTLD